MSSTGKSPGMHNGWMNWTGRRKYSGTTGATKILESEYRLKEKIITS